jgi:sortase (surface protein transpeptidase)
VVDSRSTRIALRSDVPRLTLVTCYPFDAIEPGGPLRYVVTAELAQDPAPDPPAQDRPETALGPQPTSMIRPI